MNIKVKGTDIVKEITATAFYKLCRGSKLIKIDNIPSPALYESTVFTYKTPTDEEVYNNRLLQASIRRQQWTINQQN